MIYYDRSLVNKFRIGDLFEHKHTEMLGWVVGIELSAGSEVVFRVIYANRPDAICLLHPANMNPLSLM